MAESPMLTLHYFPFPGRGGAIRDALRIGGVPFEDAQIPPDRFLAQKAAGEFPFDTLPALVIRATSGTTSAMQSNAILRYVGRLAGLYPADDAMLALKVDEAMDLGEDMGQAIGPSIREKDVERRMAMRKVLAEQTLPRLASVLERLLVANGRTGFIVGNGLTVADLKLHWAVDKLVNGSLDGIPATLLDGFAEIQRWRSNVAQVREVRLAARHAHALP